MRHPHFLLKVEYFQLFAEFAECRWYRFCVFAFLHWQSEDGRFLTVSTVRVLQVFNTDRSGLVSADLLGNWFSCSAASQYVVYLYWFPNISGWNKRNNRILCVSITEQHMQMLKHTCLHTSSLSHMTAESSDLFLMYVSWGSWTHDVSVHTFTP